MKREKFLDRDVPISLRALTVSHTISIEQIVYRERTRRGRLRDDASATGLRDFTAGINGSRRFRIRLGVRRDGEVR
jgi:hypothetical protein